MSPEHRERVLKRVEEEQAKKKFKRGK